MDGEFYCKGFLEPTAPQPWAPPPPVSPGPGWQRPQGLSWADQALAESYRRSRGAFHLSCPDGGFLLAYPLDCRRPFPLPILFCFAQVRCLSSRGWWVFSFGPDGQPRFSGGPTP